MNLEDFFMLEDEREIVRNFYLLKSRMEIAVEMEKRAEELRQLAKTAYSQKKASGGRLRARADELDRQCRVLRGFRPLLDEASYEAERLASEQSTVED